MNLDKKTLSFWKMDSVLLANIVIIILFSIILYLFFFDQEEFAPTCTDPATVINIPSGCTLNKICNLDGKTTTKITGTCNNINVSHSNYTLCSKTNGKYQLVFENNNLRCNPRVCKNGNLFNNTCVKCGNNQLYVNGECLSCKNGVLTKGNGNYTCRSTCQNMTLNGKNVTKSVTLNADNSCTYTLSGTICPNNYTGTNCTTISGTCSKGTFNNTLKLCTISTTISGYSCDSSGVCTNNILSGYTKLTSTAIQTPILCPPNYKVDSTASCAFNPGTAANVWGTGYEYKCYLDRSLINNRCAAKTFTCPKGYTSEKNSITGRYYCDKDCAEDEVLSGNPQKCRKKCPFGYTYVNDPRANGRSPITYSCVPKCPVNFTEDGIVNTTRKCISNKICPNTDYLYYDNATNKCLMPNLTTLTDATHNVKKLVCPNNFENKSGKICVHKNDSNLDSIKSYLTVTPYA
jgi:hypothetical protein